MRLFFLMALWLLGAPGFAQSTYRLDIDLDPDQSWMRGRADVSLDASLLNRETQWFYLHGELSVEQVLSNGEPVAFEQERIADEYNYSMTSTRVTLSEGLHPPGALTIVYSGRFSPSDLRSRSDYMRIAEDGVFLRGYGYSAWFPIFTDSGEDLPRRVFESVSVTAPSNLQVVLGGTRLEQVELEDGRVRTVWRPGELSAFSASLNARAWGEPVMDSSGVFTVYALPDNDSQEAARHVLAFASEFSTHMSELTGRGDEAMPFQILQMPEFGDIFAGSVIGLSDETWMDFDPEGWQARTLAHEVSHRFVQRPVSMADPAWALIKEGFPSYFYLLALRDMLGEDWYVDYMARVREAYLERRTTGLDRRGEALPSEQPILEISLEALPEFKDRFVLNDRVLLFLDDMRLHLGEESFKTFWSEAFGQEALGAQILRDAVRNSHPDYLPRWDMWLASTQWPPVTP